MDDGKEQHNQTTRTGTGYLYCPHSNGAAVQPYPTQLPEPWEPGSHSLSCCPLNGAFASRFLTPLTIITSARCRDGMSAFVPPCRKLPIKAIGRRPILANLCANRLLNISRNYNLKALFRRTPSVGSRQAAGVESAIFGVFFSGQHREVEGRPEASGRWPDRDGDDDVAGRAPWRWTVV